MSACGSCVPFHTRPCAIRRSGRPGSSTTQRSCRGSWPGHAIVSRMASSLASSSGPSTASTAVRRSASRGVSSSGLTARMGTSASRDPSVTRPLLHTIRACRQGLIPSVHNLNLWPVREKLARTPTRPLHRWCAVGEEGGRVCEKSAPPPGSADVSSVPAVRGRGPAIPAGPARRRPRTAGTDETSALPGTGETPALPGLFTDPEEGGQAMAHQVHQDGAAPHAFAPRPLVHTTDLSSRERGAGCDANELEQTIRTRAHVQDAG